MLSAANTVPAVASGSAPLDPLLILLIVFALFAARRFYVGMNGAQYSTARIMRIPVLYVILTVISAFPYGIVNVYILSTLALLPVAVVFGSFYFTRCSFFYRNGVVYYRRHMYAMLLWLVSFILRLSMEILLPFNLVIECAISGLLSFTTGIIIGEAINIRRKYNEFIHETPAAAGLV